MGGGCSDKGIFRQLSKALRKAWETTATGRRALVDEDGKYVSSGTAYQAVKGPTEKKD
jgi:hypothetical protein